MRHHDYIIVGAGPAGLQMAYFLEKSHLDYLVLEAKNNAGSFFATQPRHGKLLSINKRFNWFPEPQFNMRHDWNSLLTDDHSLLFRDYSTELYPDALDLQRYLQDFAANHVSHLRFNSKIISINRDADSSRFVLADQDGNHYTCNCLLFATGAVAPYIPKDIEGIELAEGYESHDTDPTRFDGKRVLIIGRGNSAMEVANHLAGHAAIIHIAIGNRPLKHAWQTHFVGDIRAINNTVLDMYQLKSLHATLGIRVQKITQLQDGTLEVASEDDVPHWKTPGVWKLKYVYDHVIRCTGWRYVDLSVFSAGVVPEIDEKTKYPVLSSCWESSVPNLFFVGTSMAARDRQAASGFIHGFRYNVRTLARLLAERYEGRSLPSLNFELDSVDDLHRFADYLLERFSTTDALYQLNGFMSDVLLFSPGKVEVFQELPVGYALERPELVGHDTTIVIMTLEYGFHNYPADANALNFISIPDEISDHACAAFLHPTLRRYVGGKLIDEACLNESLVIRYGHLRTLTPDPSQGRSQGQKSILMNYINKVCAVTEEVFPERMLAPARNGVGFVPWPEDRPFHNPGVPQCFASRPKEETEDASYRREVSARFRR